MAEVALTMRKSAAKALASFCFLTGAADIFVKEWGEWGRGGTKAKARGGRLFIRCGVARDGWAGLTTIAVCVGQEALKKKQMASQATAVGVWWCLCRSVCVCCVRSIRYFEISISVLVSRRGKTETEGRERGRRHNRQRKNGHARRRAMENKETR